MYYGPGGAGGVEEAEVERSGDGVDAVVLNDEWTGIMSQDLFEQHCCDPL